MTVEANTLTKGDRNMKILTALAITIFMTFATGSARAEGSVNMGQIEQALAFLDAGMAAPAAPSNAVFVGQRQSSSCCNPKNEACRTKNLTCAMFGAGWYVCGQVQCGSPLQGVWCCKN